MSAVFTGSVYGFKKGEGVGVNELNPSNAQVRLRSGILCGGESKDDDGAA